MSGEKIEEGEKQGRQIEKEKEKKKRKERERVKESDSQRGKGQEHRKKDSIEREGLAINAWRKGGKHTGSVPSAQLG